jgi:hypothetical protein
MKNFNDIRKQVGVINESDLIKIREMNKELENFEAQRAISTDGLKTLYNIQNRIHLYIEQYTDRLLHLLKQHHMVD